MPLGKLTGFESSAYKMRTTKRIVPMWKQQKGASEEVEKHKQHAINEVSEIFSRSRGLREAVYGNEYKHALNLIENMQYDLASLKTAIKGIIDIKTIMKI